MDFALHVAAIVIGWLVVASFFRSITRTTLLRSRRGDVLVASTHFVLAVIFRVIGQRARRSKLDSTACWYIPVSEFTLMFVWFGLALTGFAALYWGAGISRSITDAFISSGSALSTLGFHTQASSGGQILSIVEGAIGLIAMVYLVTFMPGVLAFTEARNLRVTKVYARAGNPPSGVGLLCWFHDYGGPAALDDMWADWETWFVSVAETQALTPPLMVDPSFRSRESWVVAAGVVIDAAAFVLACYDTKYKGSAEVCFRGGVDAMRLMHAVESSRFLPTAPVDGAAYTWQLTRGGFDAAWKALAAAGAPLASDVEKAWHDFETRRGEYEVATVWLIENVAFLPEPGLSVISMVPESTLTGV